MYGRVLTLQVRLEKRPDLDRRMAKDVVPLMKRCAGLLEILVMQDEIEVDKILILSLWKSREDLERYHVASYAKVKEVLAPYLTYPPIVHMYKIDEGGPWSMLARDAEPDALPSPKQPQDKFIPWHWQAS